MQRRIDNKIYVEGVREIVKWRNSTLLFFEKMVKKNVDVEVMKRFWVTNIPHDCCFFISLSRRVSVFYFYEFVHKWLDVSNLSWAGGCCIFDFFRVIKSLLQNWLNFIEPVRRRRYVFPVSFCVFCFLQFWLDVSFFFTR